MARLIDADKINYHEHTECMGHGDFETVRTVTEKEIAEIPTVETVEVVRCRDCKYFNILEMECQNDAISTDNEGGASYSLNFYLDDFCSYGERKEGDGNG